MTMTKKNSDNPHLAMTKLPFGKAIKKDEVFSYSQLEELTRMLRLSIDTRTMSAVLGESGVGKTTAVGLVTDELPTNKNLVVYMGQDQDGANLCRRLATGLGLQPRRSRTQTWMQISQYLADNLIEQSKNIVLIIDEAHLLDSTTLEDLRLLTNADFDRSSPVTIILTGQLPLRTRLKSPGFEALNQRLRFRYALEGFSEEETAAYIAHHLRLVQLPEDLFTPDAVRSVFLASRGILREINNLSLLSILKARDTELSSIDSKLVKQILDQRELN